MCDRLQMGAARAGDARQADNPEKAVFTLKVRGGCEVDSRGKKAGKGPLVQTNVSATIGVSQDQTLFVPKVKR